MKDQIVQITIMLLIFLNLVCFSGCLQEQEFLDNEDNNSGLFFGDVEISEYQVSTTWITGCCGDFENHSKPGFYHNLPIWSNASYDIKGTIKNIGEKELEFIRINISFYDINNTELFDLNYLNKSIIIQNLSPKISEIFTVSICAEDYHYVNNSAIFDDSFVLFHRIESLSFTIKYN